MMADLRPYPAMKDSGVPWLGEVPEHWNRKCGKWLFRKRIVQCAMLRRIMPVTGLSTLQSESQFDGSAWQRQWGSRFVRTHTIRDCLVLIKRGQELNGL